MTLQQPQSRPDKKLATDLAAKSQILCHKCGAEITFSKDHISPVTKRKVPLDPYFNNEPHQQHCMYFTAPSKPETELMLFDFLSMVPHRRQKRIIGAVGRAK
ncbi:MAG: hypothetical protein WA941_12570 [Nitrososphaeraceae archaeon]